MTFIILNYVVRKPGMTPAAFREYWDTKHIPMVKAMMGPAFPMTHQRIYMDYETGLDDPNAKPKCFFGEGPAAGFDGVARLEFEDEAAWGKFMAVGSTPEAMAKVGADNANFMDASRMLLIPVGTVSVTSRA